MKKLLLFCVMVLSAQIAFAVAIERLTSSSIRFYNWSQSSFDLTGTHLTINNTVTKVDNLNIVSGSGLMVPAGTKIEFDGLSFPASASVALWYPNAFPSNQTAGNIASFIQYGAAGQPYENIADAAGLWAAGTFIPGMPPFIRNQDYTSWGVGNWSQGLSETEFSYAQNLLIYPNPFSTRINLSSISEQIEYASISDASGKIYFSDSNGNTNDISFDTTHLKNGAYLLRIKLTSGRTLNRRLLKI